MADVPQRRQTVAERKVLRLNRKQNRGVFFNATTGQISRDRRRIMNLSQVQLGTAYPALIRERLRKGWTLTEALNTA